jgi:D-glycero-D-manno-heptose 1,7-bisphosphate phosphatase
VTAGRPAVFLDRDGTIIRDAHYLGDPAGVELLPGAAAAIARLNAAGVPAIVITNQSGIARGMFTEADYHRVRARLDELLAAEGARIDDSLHCPHHPEHGETCECRKPGTLLYREAAARHGLDLAASVGIGDRWRDLEPVIALGGAGVLVPTPFTSPEDVARARAQASIADDLGAAVERALRLMRRR